MLTSGKMKINYIYCLAFAVAALSAVSCTREPVQGTVSDAVGGDGYYEADEEGIVPGWVRVKLAPEAEPLRVGALTRGNIDSGNSALDAVAEELGATEIRRVFNEGGRFAERRRRYGLHLWYDLKIGDGVPVTRAESSIAGIDGIVHVQPIYKVRRADVAILPAEYVYVPATSAIRPSMSGELPFNDEYLSQQWHYNNDGSLAGSVAGADINLFEGWNVIGTHGDPDVVVGVIDSGVQYDHPDLADNMWVNEAEMSGVEGVDDDNNGYVDDFWGANFMPSYRPHTPDAPGVLTPGLHGTHVAGTIAAVNNNGVGVCGVAGGSGEGDGVKIMTLQIMTDSASDDVAMADIFAYAADMGANIVNCSWTYSQDVMPQDIAEGVAYFIANAGMDEQTGLQTGPMAGGLVIAAAGNSGTNEVFYPAKAQNVVGVGGMTAAGTVGWYSEYGEGINIMAPGGDNRGEANLQVLSTLPGSTYGYMAGTSMACPHVTGVAALILSHFKGDGFTCDDLRARLEGSCRPLGSDMDTKYHNGVGNGLIDVTLSLTEMPAEGPQTPAFEGETLPTAVRIYGPCPLDGNGMPVAKYNFEYAQIVDGEQQEVTRTVLTNTAYAGETFEYVFEGGSDMEYAFRINAVDRYGRESEYCSFTCATAEWENHAPEIVRELGNMEIGKAGENNRRLVAIYQYFSDADERYGDSITYTVESSDEEIVGIEVAAGGRSFYVLPLRKGEADVTVVATDTRGASATVSMHVTVLAASDNSPVVVQEFEPLTLPDNGEFSKEYDLEQYFSDPNMPDDVLMYDITISDAEVVAVSVDNSIMTVTALGEGVAEVSVTVTDQNGESAESMLAVTVNASPSDEPTAVAGGMSLYPNPVDEMLNVAIDGASADMVEITIYDAAARKVRTDNVALNDGIYTLNGLGSLSPGVYSVRVECGGTVYNGNIVKR